VNRKEAAHTTFHKGQLPDTTNPPIYHIPESKYPTPIQRLLIILFNLQMLHTTAGYAKVIMTDPYTRNWNE
jgi:hypothetical protein